MAVAGAGEMLLIEARRRRDSDNAGLSMLLLFVVLWLLLLIVILMLEYCCVTVLCDWQLLRMIIGSSCLCGSIAPVAKLQINYYRPEAKVYSPPLKREGW